MHKTELAQIPKLRGEAALADDAETRCAAFTARETELYSAIEVAEIRIAKLQKKMSEQINFGRRDRIDHHRREAARAFEALRRALLAAVEANEAATQAYAAASTELGAGDAFSLVSRADYLPPGAVVRDMVEHWASVVHRELDGAARTAPRSPASAQPIAVPAKSDATELIPHGSPGKGPTRLFEVPPLLGSATPATAKSAAPTMTAKPAAPKAAPTFAASLVSPVLPKADADGNIEIVVMRRGAEIAGRGRRAGEQIKVPFADAEAAVRAGVADFASEATT